MKRKLTLSLTALMLLTALTGCNGGSENSHKPVIVDPTPTPTEGQVTPTQGGHTTPTPTPTPSEPVTPTPTPTQGGTTTPTPTPTPTPSQGGEDIDSVTLTFIEVYNDVYFKFSYDHDPCNVKNHKFKQLNLNGKQTWCESIPEGKILNVKVDDVLLTEYKFDWIDTNDVTYLSFTYTQEVVEPEEPKDDQGRILLEFHVKQIYGGDEYGKVTYNIDPFREKYNFAYYTVNDNGNETFHVNDRLGDDLVLQIHVGQNISGEVVMKFYNTSSVNYAIATFNWAVE